MALFVDTKKKSALNDLDGSLPRRHLHGDQGFGVEVSRVLHVPPSIRSSDTQMHTQKKCGQFNTRMGNNGLEALLNSFLRNDGQPGINGAEVVGHYRTDIVTICAENF